MKRETGYYWVLYHGDWRIFEYENEYWWNTGYRDRYDDEEFTEIDERKIERP